MLRFATHVEKVMRPIPNVGAHADYPRTDDQRKAKKRPER
jgi:hypothetical protein